MRTEMLAARTLEPLSEITNIRPEDIEIFQVMGENIVDYLLRLESCAFDEFTYFGIPDMEYSSENARYVMAIAKNRLVGVIKWGECKPLKCSQYLAYIDVSVKCRKMGIARMMTRELNKYLDENQWLYLSEESNEGYEAGMARMFKREITKCKTLTAEETEEFLFG